MGASQNCKNEIAYSGVERNTQHLQSAQALRGPGGTTSNCGFYRPGKHRDQKRKGGGENQVTASRKLKKKEDCCDRKFGGIRYKKS